MSAPTTLRTDRLLRRPFVSADAADVRRLANDLEIARSTLSIPHPYPEGHAESWFESVEVAIAVGRGAVFAVCDAAGGAPVGAIGLHIDRKHEREEHAAHERHEGR